MKKHLPMILISIIVILMIIILALLGKLYMPSAKTIQPIESEPTILEPTEVPVKITVVEPSCTEAGYTIYENVHTGIIEVGDNVPALGHSFGEWEADPDAGGSVRACAVCGETQNRLPIKEIDMTKIELSGSMDGISKEERVLLEAFVRDEGNSFSCYSYTSWQGHSTLKNEKKNYTLRFFADTQLTEKFRLAMRPGWQLEHKYILKANYADVTQSRNLICADVWSDMAASRANVHPRLVRTSNYGAVDGFPVSVWHNSEFLGLYTLNLHKDDDLYQMHSGNRDAVIICNAQTMDESLFRAAAVFAEDESDWEMEFCTEEERQWAQEWFNEMIAFVMEADDETFTAQLHDYLDVDAAIDYMLFMYAMGLTDSAAKDLVMLTYEGGPWIPTVYDMEDAFGLSADGASAKAADEFLPVLNDGAWSSGTDSLLWDRLLQNFGAEISLRWMELRQNVFEEQTLMAQAEQRLDAVSEEAIKMDMERYPNRTVIENPREQILSYIQQRLPLLDSLFVVSQE